MRDDDKKPIKEVRCKQCKSRRIKIFSRNLKTEILFDCQGCGYKCRVFIQPNQETIMELKPENPLWRNR